MSPSTRFTTIPVEQVPLDRVFYDHQNGQYEEASRVSRDPSSGKPLVLIVDDEQLIANTLSTILAQNGYSVRTAYDGLSALELATQQCPDLLITDVDMPGMNGVDLAVAVDKTLPSCKIIIFSGKASTTDLLATAQEAGHRFLALAKPVHPTVMLAHAAERLSQRQNLMPDFQPLALPA